MLWESQSLKYLIADGHREDRLASVGGSLWNLVNRLKFVPNKFTL